MKSNYLLIALALLVFSCSSDSDNASEPVDQLLGEWQITSRLVNNIGSLAVLTGNFEFLEDSNPNDNRGIAINTDSAGFETELKFIVSPSSQTILFTDDDGNETTYNYTVEGDVLSFDYSNEEGNISELWEKL